MLAGAVRFLRRKRMLIPIIVQRFNLCIRNAGSRW
jgi:hypothetical protein